MTPAEEAQFIQLWQAGTETAAIAQALGIPPGTARSRAYALQQQGKIHPRPKGGNRRRSTVHPDTDHRLPSTVDPRPSTVHPLQADLAAALTAALKPVLARLDALETGLARQEHEDRPPSTLTHGS